MIHKSAVNRAKLVDEPIVEMLLSRRYYKSGIKFMMADLQSDFDGTDIIIQVNGTQRSLNVKRNSSAYYNSPNFTITLDKNNLNTFNNTTFVFIDEVADALYVVDGLKLLKYVLDNQNKVLPSKTSDTKHFVILPKKELVDMLEDNPSAIIKYNKQIAKLFELGRDENLYKGV